MEFFHPDKLKINFTKAFKICKWISIAMLIAGVIAFFKPGPNYGIDFKGGIQIEAEFPGVKVDDGKLREILSSVIEGFSIQTAMEGNITRYLITSNTEEKESVSTLVNQTLTKNFGATSPKTWQIVKVDTVGPKIASNLSKAALLSIIYVCLLITIYMYWRFDWRYAPGAIACIFHDLIITVGILCIAQVEFSTSIIAALLTLAGYSINDTVVVFDRVREMEQKLLGKSRVAVVNQALKSCFGRTVVTSLTTLFSCMALYFFGGKGLQSFSLTLLFGILIGTYSSIYIACPLYLWACEKFGESGQLQNA